ncbi:predicted protein [Nematostella vectensis]|uniref:Uncharacterized protein n=1 Tax=Nematostella vectensis TaxID=45351 RepID=A7SXF3_NEMVE|nr:predicted protein [Nematostella vectensis]|eukprot:XP_001623723.1 predicted protein [Nematostella vectensis]
MKFKYEKYSSIHKYTVSISVIISIIAIRLRMRVTGAKEYFCNDVWNRVPFSWRQHFSDIRPDDLATVLLNKCGKDTKIVPRNYRHVWPLSLLSFVQACHSLSLPRSPVFESCRAGPCCQPHVGMRNEASLKHLRSQVKSKKLHEITKLAWVGEIFL